MDASIFDDVHDYWFGPLPAFDSFPPDRFPIWFGGGDVVDREITRRFGTALEALGRVTTELDGLTLRQQVGRIVLIDQMSRNIHRNSPRAYEIDAQARHHASGLGRFKLVEQVFVILPLGHNEDLADQNRAVELYLGEIAPHTPDGNGFYEACRIQSQKYRDIIARFGRFPHRNAVLGRATTPEEEAFMAEAKMEPF
jgi:uncharacterized protein (DUF924 family)